MSASTESSRNRTQSDSIPIAWTQRWMDLFILAAVAALLASLFETRSMARMAGLQFSSFDLQGFHYIAAGMAIRFALLASMIGIVIWNLTLGFRRLLVAGGLPPRQSTFMLTFLWLVVVVGSLSAAILLAAGSHDPVYEVRIHAILGLMGVWLLCFSTLLRRRGLPTWITWPSCILLLAFCWQAQHLAAFYSHENELTYEQGHYTQLFARDSALLSWPFWSSHDSGPMDTPFKVSHPQGFDHFSEWPGMYPLRRRLKPIVVIQIDDLRSDHLGCYGSVLELTPALDTFALDASVMEQAYTISPDPGLTWRAVWSGRYDACYQTGTPDYPLLQTLAGLGYETVLLTDEAHPTSMFGNVAPAFAAFYQTQLPDVDCQTLPYASPTEVVANALSHFSDMQNRASLRDAGHTGMIMALHLQRDPNTEPYSKYIQTIDQAFGELMQGLQDHHSFEDAIVIVYGGSGLDLRRDLTATRSHYEERIRVPLMIRIPSTPSHRITEPVSLLDMAPTLLNIYDSEGLNPFDGISLLPFLTTSMNAIHRSSFLQVNPHHNSVSIVWNGEWKYILYRREGYEQLFDLAVDPAEHYSLIDKDHQLTSSLRRLARRFLDTMENKHLRFGHSP